ncbi:LysR substrate-binding domain-containing protein [Priestia megaterium]|uniref:LysR substrate-binding domain-containing protein n=1 Tax=Priestia megaterium TaxID=1404 RepID=UPI002E1FBD2A|nr:LysR substrate-binding domain-containing protein [Priestia megaterium]
MSAPILFPRHFPRDNQLHNQRWISYGLELPIIRRFWRQHFKKRPEIQPHHVIPNLQTVLKAIQHHMGISLLPRYLIQEALREKKVKIELEHLAVKNQIFLAYKLKHRDHPTIQKTIRSLKKEEGEK